MRCNLKVNKSIFVRMWQDNCTQLIGCKTEVIYPYLWTCGLLFCSVSEIKGGKIFVVSFLALQDLFKCNLGTTGSTFCRATAIVSSMRFSLFCKSMGYPLTCVNCLAGKFLQLFEFHVWTVTYFVISDFHLAVALKEHVLKSVPSEWLSFL